MTDLIKVSISLVPVFVFLTALIFIDSYKLVKLRSVVRTIAVGCLVAVAALFLNSWILATFGMDTTLYSRYAAPEIEETLKAAYLIYLIHSHKVGFIVDAAIYGFAIGAGFAFIENIYYLRALESSNILLWVIRGFGTAIMHGGTTTLFGILSKSLADRHPAANTWIFLPGLGVAVVTHLAFNHFILPPLFTTLILLIVLPLLIALAFERSEKATRSWLGVGFDTDIELLEMITAGRISETRVGEYLHSLTTRFKGEIVADMLCMLRLHLELATRAKGILMMKKTGFDIEPDPEIKEKFAELNYLGKSIGKTGKLALSPFLHTSSRDLWQLYMLSR